MTDAERKLWYAIKAHRLCGVQFRRQVPLGRYILDFASHKARIILEVDGGQHFSEEGSIRDEKRDAWLNSQGYRVLRFSNSEVLSNLDGVVQKLTVKLDSFTPLPALPHKGGGELKSDLTAMIEASDMSIVFSVLAIFFSAAALGVSLVTMWMTLFRRGKLKMTQSTAIAFKFGGIDPSPLVGEGWEGGLMPHAQVPARQRNQAKRLRKIMTDRTNNTPRPPARCASDLPRKEGGEMGTS